MNHFFESSFRDLFSSTENAFPNTTARQFAIDPVQVEVLRWTPFVGMNTLFITGEVRNEDRHYKTSMLFKNINYNGNEVQITASDGLEYSFDKLSLEDTDILVRCNCPDLYWRGVHYLKLDNSLYGKDRQPYVGQGLWEANPSKLPILCKHLIKCIKSLEHANLFD